MYLSKRKGKNTSFCFGTGREAFEKVVMPGKYKEADRCVPGPGTYKFDMNFGSGKKKFSFGEKL